jgi:hypothetical protein
MAPRFAYRALGALALAALLGACARGEPDLMRLSSGQEGPDEFAIVPGKPIEMPPDLAALPPPAPEGAANRADPTPEADAVAALGGRPERLERDGRAPDGALLRAAGRHGVQPDIRDQLAEADQAFRGDNRGRVLERVFNVTTYFDAYARSELDKHAEQERWRRAGARSSAAPPPPPAE